MLISIRSALAQETIYLYIDFHFPVEHLPQRFVYNAMYIKACRFVYLFFVAVLPLDPALASARRVLLHLHLRASLVALLAVDRAVGQQHLGNSKQISVTMVNSTTSKDITLKNYICPKGTWENRNIASVCKWEKPQR